MDILLIIIAYCLGFLVGFFPGIILHETGHLICGKLSGFRFLSFRIMNFLWAKDERGRLKLTVSPRLSGIGGQCLMAPREDEADSRFILYNLGGGLANVLVGALVLLPCFWLANTYAIGFLIGAGLVNLLLGVTNLIPKRSPVPNDGANLREAKKSADAAHGFYLMLKVNAEMAGGKRARDYPEDTFALREDADRENYLVANVDMLRSMQLEEAGRFEESYKTLLDSPTEKLPPYYETAAVLLLIFHEVVYFGDEASITRARERMKAKAGDKVFHKLLNMKNPAFLPYRAAKLAFLDDDPAQARELIAQARTSLPTLQNPGQEFSLTLALDRLEAALREKEERESQIQGTN